MNQPNRPESEMLLVVLEKKQLNNGKIIYTGFLGNNSIYADEYKGKLWVKLQKWAKRDKIDDLTNKAALHKEGFKEQSSFTEEDLPF